MITIKMQAARWMAACWFRSEWVLLYQKQLKWQWFKLLFAYQALQSLILPNYRCSACVAV